MPLRNDLATNHVSSKVEVFHHADPAFHPIKWEVLCFGPGKGDFGSPRNHECVATYQTGCDEYGKLTTGKEKPDCAVQCGCFNFTPADEEPPTSHISKEKSLRTLHEPLRFDPTTVSRIEAASPFDFVDYTRNVPRSEVDSPNEAESKDEVISPRAALHDYGVMCYLDEGKGAEDLKTQKRCVAPPYRYTCNQNSFVGWVTFDQTCATNCRCVNINPRPKIINWAVGQVPASGSWGKRALATSSDSTEGDAQQPEADEQAETDDQQADLELLPGMPTSKDLDGNIDDQFIDDEATSLDLLHRPSQHKALHEWGPVCSVVQNGQKIHNADLTRFCTTARGGSYSCDSRGALISRAYHLGCEDACDCMNFK